MGSVSGDGQQSSPAVAILATAISTAAIAGFPGRTLIPRAHILCVETWFKPQTEVSKTPVSGCRSGSNAAGLGAPSAFIFLLSKMKRATLPLWET